MSRDYFVNRSLENIQKVCQDAGIENDYFTVVDHLEKLEEDCDQIFAEERAKLKAEIEDLEAECRDADDNVDRLKRVRSTLQELLDDELY